MTTPLDPDEYLQALADARAERDAIHPHEPVLDPRPTGRHLTAVASPDARAARPDRPEASTGRWLTDDERTLGLRRLAEMRERIARLHRPTRKDLPA